jgi:hypothetical protein
MVEEDRRDALAWVFDFLSERGILTVKATGKVTSGTSPKLFDAIARELQQRGARAVLVDYRDAQIKFSVVEIYELPDVQRDRGLPTSIRAALLVAPDAMAREDLEFFEDRQFNSGQPVQVFHDGDAALDWLAAPKP